MITIKGYFGIFSILATVIKSDNNLAGAGYCSFPSFLWTPADGVEMRQRQWLSNTEFHADGDKLKKQKNITVAETEITINLISFPCSAGNMERQSSHCYWRVLEFKIICIQEEPDGKIRVQQESNGRFEFTCMKFERLAPGLVQVFSASPKDENEARLCFNTALHRQEWPWIDPSVVVWSPCPLSGGFDFRPSFLSEVTIDGCIETWLPGRMESECILGEGIHFMFPNGTCNPFNPHSTEFRLQCRAVWTEGSFTFYLLSETNETPRYTLRLPVNAEDLSTFNGQLYLSAVAPISSMGRPPGDVLALTMYMTRTAAGSCYDESDSCKEFAEQGKCTNTAFHQFASHCVKSCGLCDMAPRNTSECYFSEDLVGEFYLFSERGHDSWHVTHPVISTSELGTFYCKSKHWNRDFYKTLSIYKNGCRPRYSCIELYRTRTEQLKFRLSHSSLIDKSFSLCTFRDDPLPVGDNIRSQVRKVLIASSVVQFGRCDLGLSVRVNVTTGPASSCDGYMTDIDRNSCTLSQHLTLTLNNCFHLPDIDFYCEATGSLDSGTRLLILQQSSSQLHQCFIVKTSRDAFGAKTFHFETTRCSTQTILPSSQKLGVNSITTYTDIVDHPCPTKLFLRRVTTRSPTGLLSSPKTAELQNHQTTTPRFHTHKYRRTESDNGFNNQISHTPERTQGSVLCITVLQLIVFMSVHL